MYTVPGAHGVHAAEPGSLNPEPHVGHLSTLPSEKWFTSHSFSFTRSDVPGSSVTSCPACTVWQNVAFRLQRGHLKRPKAEAREIAIEKLRRVGIAPDVADRLPAELSGGMQKRVSLARAIAAEPEIIFF